MDGYFIFWVIKYLLLIQLITNTAYLKLYEEGFEQKGLFWKKNIFGLISNVFGKLASEETKKFALITQTNTIKRIEKKIFLNF